MSCPTRSNSKQTKYYIYCQPQLINSFSVNVDLGESIILKYVEPRTHGRGYKKNLKQPCC